MNKQDIILKKLFSSKEIFADFINTTVHQGKEVVNPRKYSRVRK